MKETYEMSPDGELVVTWEAEDEEDMAELHRRALQAAEEGLPDGVEVTVWAGSTPADPPTRIDL